MFPFKKAQKKHKKSTQKAQKNKKKQQNTSGKTALKNKVFFFSTFFATFPVLFLCFFCFYFAFDFPGYILQSHCWCFFLTLFHNLINPGFHGFCLPMPYLTLNPKPPCCLVALAEPRRNPRQRAPPRQSRAESFSVVVVFLLAIKIIILMIKILIITLRKHNNN